MIIKGKFKKVVKGGRYEYILIDVNSNPYAKENLIKIDVYENKSRSVRPYKEGDKVTCEVFLKGMVYNGKHYNRMSILSIYPSSSVGKAKEEEEKMMEVDDFYGNKVESGKVVDDIYKHQGKSYFIDDDKQKKDTPF